MQFLSRSKCLVKNNFWLFSVALSISQPYVFNCLQHIYIPRATGDPVSWLSDMSWPRTLFQTATQAWFLVFVRLHAHPAGHAVTPMFCQSGKLEKVSSKAWFPFILWPSSLLDDSCWVHHPLKHNLSYSSSADVAHLRSSLRLPKKDIEWKDHSKSNFSVAKGNILRSSELHFPSTFTILERGLTLSLCLDSGPMIFCDPSEYRFSELSW